MNDSRKKTIDDLMELIESGSVIDERGKLPTERVLSDLLKVSRTLLREAIVSLEAMGLLEVRERQGIFLLGRGNRDLPPRIGLAFLWPMETLGQVMEIRQIIEGKAAYLASLRRTDDEVEKLKACLGELKMIFSGHGSDEAQQGAYWNTVLHNTIFQATHNTILSRIHENITELMEKSIVSMRMQILDSEQPERAAAILQQHEDLVNAIVMQDSHKALKAAESHLGYTFDILEEQSKLNPFSELLTRRLEINSES